MDPENPFDGEDDDRTVMQPTSRQGEARIVKPNPGKHRAANPALEDAAQRPSAPLYVSGHGPVQALRLTGTGFNPLVDAAAGLLSLVPQLRATLHHADISGLFRHITGEIKSFQKQAQQNGAREKQIVAARYALCSVVDETVLSTPWGSDSAWSNQTLLSKFHNERWGGEKFFQIVKRISQEPARNLDLLELMYICLALGFEGKYRVSDRGRSRLEQVRDNLYQTLRRQKGEFERELSPRWRGLQQLGDALTSNVPAWVLGAVSGLLLAGAFLWFVFRLNSISDPVFLTVNQLAGDVPPIARKLTQPPPPPPAPPPRFFEPWLAEEIRQGLVYLRTDAQRSTVIIRGDGLFQSGSAGIRPKYLGTLERIGKALNQVTGSVFVTGHTDNVPIRRSFRYPSNWHLSKARADAVVQFLTPLVNQPQRLRPEGRGEAEPLHPSEPQNSPETRATNRRVELSVLNSELPQ